MNATARHILLIVAVGWLLASPAALAAARPNVLLIYTDDQSQRSLSCYREEGAWPWVSTPHIDRLAREGVRFTHAYGASWCTPSRACVLTGLLPHGIQGVRLQGVLEGSCDPAVRRFWPRELRQAGYHTAMIGKWHLGHDAGHGRQWDHSVVWDQADIRGDWYNDQLLSVDGEPKKVVPGYSTDVYTRFAVQYIRRKHERPWLLWLCYNAPHLPNTVHARHRASYQDAEAPIPEDVFGPRPDKPRYMLNYTKYRKGPDGAVCYGKTPLPEMVRGYNRLVSAVDEGVGQLLRTLEETGQLDNTLIVYTSDQGFAWGEHGFAWKVGPYDACLRMPLIFRLPSSVARGAVCRQPATIVDLAPTVLGFARVPEPWPMHGRDLRPLLEKPDAPWDRPVMMEHFGLRFGAQTDRGITGPDAIGGVPWWLFLRQGKYKYIRTLVADEVEELYDLETDPQELKNLATQPSNQGVLSNCREQLAAELTRTKAGLRDNLPAVRAAGP